MTKKTEQTTVHLVLRRVPWVARNLTLKLLDTQTGEWRPLVVQIYEPAADERRTPVPNKQKERSK